MRKQVWRVLFLLALANAGNVLAQDAASYINAGNQMYAAKDYAKAVQYYQAATAKDPNSASAYQGLGNSHYGLGQKPEALAAYEKALQLNPNNPQLSSFVQSLRTQLGASASPAATTPAANTNYSANTGSTSASKNFVISPMAGVAVGAPVGIGIGGHLRGIYMVDGKLGLGGSIGAFMFGDSTVTTGNYFTQAFTVGTMTRTTSNSLMSLEILPMVKYVFGESSIKPYAVGGVGLNMLMSSSSTTYNYQNGPPAGSSPSSTNTPGGSAMYPMIQAGGGVEFQMGPDFSLFGEAKYSLIISGAGTASYAPIEFGANIGI